MTVMIDADYVLKIICDQLYGEMSAGDEELYDHKTYDDGLEWCFELIRNVANNTAPVKHAHSEEINNAPTVDAKPVKHAHWDIDFPRMNPNFPEYVCSSCGMHSWAKTKYCPDCGAKMDSMLESVERNYEND